MMNSVMTKIAEFFAENANGLIVNIISTLLCFIVAFWFITRQKIKISKWIAIGVNIKQEGVRRLAWKFKIVNKSIFTSFVNFDIQLVGINYKRSADGTLTQHRDKIDVVAGVRELKRNIPFPILQLKRMLVKQDENINFAYRPVTFQNLSEEFNKYDEYELNILCVDTLIGKPHSFTKVFKKSKKIICQGDFSNDGRLNKICDLKSDDKIFVQTELDKLQKQ